MPGLSILIPCLGGAAEFDGTLISVLQHRPADCEVIVLHTDEYGDPYGLAGEVRFIRCKAPASLVDLVNAGIEASEGSIVHVLACGLESTEGWTEPALAHFAEHEVTAVAPAVTDTSGTRLVSAGMRFSMSGGRCVLRNARLIAARSAARVLASGAPTLVAGFYRREVLIALRGFDHEAGDHLTDADLAVMLTNLELRVVLEPSSRIVQVIDPLGRVGQSQFARGRICEQLFWRSASRFGSPLALTLHAVAILADPAALLGRLAALMDWGAKARFGRRLTAAANRLEPMHAQERPTLPMPTTKPVAQRPDKQHRRAA